MFNSCNGRSYDDRREEERARNEARKRKRCFHRVVCGVEKSGVGPLRFLTLTSSRVAPKDIQRSFRCLMGRLVRRGLVTGYIKVTEYNQKGDLMHLHVLMRGSYVAQWYLSQLWEKIHLSPIVDVRKAYGRKADVAAYLAKYMVKAGERYSWNRAWVYQGFVQTWVELKRKACYVPQRYRDQFFRFILKAWQGHLRLGTPPECLLTAVDTMKYNFRRHVGCIGLADGFAGT